MKKVLFAAAVAAIAGAANADVTISFGGPQNFVGSGGFTQTSPALYGTLTGVIYHFSYSNAANASWSNDMACTVDSVQWGGYDVFINGATVDAGSIGAGNSGAAINFTSAVLGMPAAVAYNGGTAVVGYGNAYSSGSCTLSDVSVTLVGVDLVPTPGAAAVMGLGGLAAFRRRR